MSPEDEAILAAKSARLHAVLKILPTDYTDYGGHVERWADDNAAYPDCSCGCKWAEWLAEGLGSDWCVCTKPGAPRAGLVTFEHMTGQGCFEGMSQAEIDEDCRFHGWELGGPSATPSNKVVLATGFVHRCPE